MSIAAMAICRWSGESSRSSTLKPATFSFHRGPQLGKIAIRCFTDHGVALARNEVRTQIGSGLLEGHGPRSLHTGNLDNRKAVIAHLDDFKISGALRQAKGHRSRCGDHFAIYAVQGTPGRSIRGKERSGPDLKPLLPGHRE
jgi:hypothetical protein